jgi:hypothetical protein
VLLIWQDLRSEGQSLLLCGSQVLLLCLINMLTSGVTKRSAPHACVTVLWDNEYSDQVAIYNGSLKV